MLEHLFDAELQHRQGMKPLVGPADAAGELVGSGDGTIRGPALVGTLRWTLYESPGRLLCSMNPLVLIETDDGGQIRLEARGYARRPSEHHQTWAVAATLRFESDDERYRWLNERLGVWEGEFDAASHHAHYRAYVHADGARASSRSALELAGIRPARWGARRTAALTPSERDFYQWILGRFGRDGRPSAQALGKRAQRIGLDLERALETFAREDLVHVGADGEIGVAYPFSGQPTAHRVRFESGREVFAMCAIDALGIAPMLDEPIQIRSRDPHNGDEIRVEVAPDGSAASQPDTAVVVVGCGRSGASFNACCPLLNFFTSSETADGWLSEHPRVDGRCISIEEAVEAGRLVFGEVLR